MSVPKIRPIHVGGGLAAALAIIVPFIAQHEGHTSRAYHDIGGVLTVCNGHTGPDIRPKHHYSDAECKDMLDKDVQVRADAIVKISPELLDKPYVLASTISFSYNVGVRTYQHSSVARDFHAGQFAQGCADMKKYVFAGGKFSRGLANRRQAEYTLCMKGV